MNFFFFCDADFIAVFCEKLGVLYESKEFVREIMEVAYKKDIFLHGSRAFE